MVPQLLCVPPVHPFSCIPIPRPYRRAPSPAQRWRTHVPAQLQPARRQHHHHRRGPALRRGRAHHRRGPAAQRPGRDDRRRQPRPGRARHGRRQPRGDHPRQRGGLLHPAPQHGPPHGLGSAGAVPRHQVRLRARHRERLLLRLRPRGALLRGGAGGHRGQDGRARQAGRAGHPRRHEPAAGRAALRRPALQAGPDPPPRRDRGGRAEHLPHGQLRRPVRGAPRAHHQGAQGLQAALGGRRLLAGQQRQRHAPAHLRHQLVQEEGTRRAPADAGGGQEARPPQAGPRARPLRYHGPGGPGPELLVPPRRPAARPDHRLLEGRAPAQRLPDRHHPAHQPGRPVGDLGPHGVLPRRHVRLRAGRPCPTWSSP